MNAACLRGRSLPGPQRRRRGGRGPHEQPTVRGDEGLRRRAGVLRPRGPDGQARGRARARPGRAAAAQRRSRRVTRSSPDRCCAVLRPSPRSSGPAPRHRFRPAVLQTAAELALPGGAGRTADRHRVRRGVGFARGVQEPHVLGRLRRLLDGSVPARGRRGHDHLRCSRGRAGLCHPRPADRPRGARGRRGRCWRLRAPWTSARRARPRPAARPGCPVGPSRRPAGPCAIVSSPRSRAGSACRSRSSSSVDGSVVSLDGSVDLALSEAAAGEVLEETVDVPAPPDRRARRRRAR